MPNPSTGRASASTAAPFATPPWIGVTELLGSHIEPPDWLVDGFIARGDIALLAAPAAHGKTILALDLALALASSHSRELGPARALGHLRVPTRGRTAFLELEMNRERTARYVARLVAGRELEPFDVQGRLGFWLDRPFKLDVDRERIALTAEMLDYSEAGHHYGVGAGLDLIVVDTLRRCLMGDEQDSGAVSTFFGALRTMSAALGNPAVLVLHHFRKQGQNDHSEPADRIRGSSDILNAVDHAYVVSSKHGGRHRIEPIKSRERELPAFCVRFDGYGEDHAQGDEASPLRLTHEDATESAIEAAADVQRQIRELLASGPPGGMPRHRVIEALKAPGRSERVLNDAFRHLKTLGVAEAARSSGQRSMSIWRLSGVVQDFGFGPVEGQNGGPVA